MRLPLIAIYLLSLGGCFPFDELQTATREQIIEILAICGVSEGNITRQSDSSFIVYLSDNESDRPRKRRCLKNEQEKKEIMFAFVG